VTGASRARSADGGRSRRRLRDAPRWRARTVGELVGRADEAGAIRLAAARRRAGLARAAHPLFLTPPARPAARDAGAGAVIAARARQRIAGIDAGSRLGAALARGAAGRGLAPDADPARVACTRVAGAHACAAGASQELSAELGTSRRRGRRLPAANGGQRSRGEDAAEEAQHRAPGPTFREGLRELVESLHHAPPACAAPGAAQRCRAVGRQESSRAAMPAAGGATLPRGGPGEGRRDARFADVTARPPSARRARRNAGVCEMACASPPRGASSRARDRGGAEPAFVAPRVPAALRQHPLAEAREQAEIERDVAASE